MGVLPARDLMSCRHVVEVYDAVPMAPHSRASGADLSEQTAMGAYPDLSN